MHAITFSSDIGLNDYLVGAIKGQLVTAVPSCNIVDISHQLSPSNYQQAAYVCSNAFKYFPANTFHIIIINFFEKAPEHLLLAEYNGQYIFCADNGILTMITGEKPGKIYAISTKLKGKCSLLDCTHIIAQSIKKMLKGEGLENITAITDIEEKYPMRSAIGQDWIDSQIIYIDNFENIVLNLTRSEFEEIKGDRNFKIALMRNSEFITKISDHYAGVHPGENLAFFNAADYLELAINKGNMAGLFGLQSYNEINSNMQNRLLYQTVRITFE